VQHSESRLLGREMGRCWRTGRGAVSRHAKPVRATCARARNAPVQHIGCARELAPPCAGLSTFHVGVSCAIASQCACNKAATICQKRVKHTCIHTYIYTYIHEESTHIHKKRLKHFRLPRPGKPRTPLTLHLGLPGGAAGAMDTRARLCAAPATSGQRYWMMCTASRGV
jgi:hypothetical protein